MVSEQLENKIQNKKNNLWWLLIIVLIAAGVFANYYFSSIAWPIRLAGWIVLSCIAVIAFLCTAAGKKVFVFAKEARVELNKIFWPTRQETVQTTALIAGLVVLTSVILWGLDTVLLWAVNWLTGQHG